MYFEILSDVYIILSDVIIIQTLKYNIVFIIYQQ